MKSVARREIDEYKKDPIKALEQLEICEFECDGGPLKTNVAYQAIKELLLEYEEK